MKEIDEKQFNDLLGIPAMTMEEAVNRQDYHGDYADKETQNPVSNEESHQEMKRPSVERPVERTAPAPTAGLGYIDRVDPHHVERPDVIEKLKKLGTSNIGDNIVAQAEIRDGWVPVDRKLLGERNVFYPADWTFKIRPATVEAIRNWSTINEDDVYGVDEVFTEIVKSNIAITSPQGPVSSGAIRQWDRFFFLLLIREYTFMNGDRRIEFNDECTNCSKDVTFNLTSSALMFEMPDDDVMQYYNQEAQCWEIDPAEFDVYDATGKEVLFPPTIERDNRIKEWMIARAREVQNTNKKAYDEVFIKFLPWMTPQISKDPDIAKRQIKECERRYLGWTAEMFSFMNEVINNINVKPLEKLVSHCPYCGEEVTSKIQFPNGVRGLFDVPGRHRKFGSK